MPLSTFWSAAVTSNDTFDPEVLDALAWAGARSATSPPGYVQRIDDFRCFQVTAPSSNEIGRAYALSRRVSAFPPRTVRTRVADWTFALSGIVVSVSNVRTERRSYVSSLLRRVRSSVLLPKFVVA